MAVTVGLLTDPGLPERVTRELVDELPAALREHVSDDVDWQVALRCRPLVIDEEGTIPIAELAERELPRHGWDLMVCVTDLPRHVAGKPVIADVSTKHGVALASLPAVGGVRLRAHLRDTLLQLTAELSEQGPRCTKKLVTPTRRVENPAEGIDASLALPGLRGRLRLLFGMVRDNRPWRLVPSLSRALAAAAATAAFGVFYNSIWTMADALSPPRLAVVNLFAVGAMVVWLTAYNHLWEHARGRGTRNQVVLYNTASITTLTLGVACMYALLFALTVVAALAVISGGYLARMLGHEVGITDYLTLAWLAASMGTVAGALGSSLESEDAVRHATYSKRERERRARNEDG
ncbi:hypothetical protein FPZ12_037090 [Amycolatopsis acidicola]|uniref:DUF2267 domain-containing protein n=1 Tax=Amycolatopsis acidicola TaxID=2596893 RepID=A0A5N0UUR8_9PSEU|nr:hypothetical protein [Amycolatopsis acidicola]KAA9152302.1 hypothetical protein FPZ12_037090 [Amycolatopsis acidicola]